MINFGNKLVDNAFIGNTSVVKMYYNNECVWPPNNLTKFTIDNGSIIFKNIIGEFNSSDIPTDKIIVDVQFGNSITSIGNAAFVNQTELTSVFIPNTISAIGLSAFKGCTGLSSVYISDLQAWCSVDLSDETSNPLYYAHDLYVNDELVDTLQIPTNVTDIKNLVFCGCRINKVALPASVSSIQPQTFSYCANLSAFAIDEQNENYSAVNGLLLNKPSMTEIVGGINGNVAIPDSVKTINEYAFQGRRNLSSLSVNNNLLTSKSNAFQGCSGISDLHISNISGWCGIGFGNADANPGYYADDIYYGNDKLISVEIPNGTQTINFATFYGFDDILSIILPDSVKAIQSYAFYDCHNIENIDLGDGLLSVRHDAFTQCSSLTSLNLPDTLIHIERLSFYKCSHLSTFNFGNTRTTIPYLQNYNAFNGTAAQMKIIVPDALYDNWITADQWNNVNSHIIKWSNYNS